MPIDTIFFKPLNKSMVIVQGGSDISGPLSKPHPHIKKSYFLLIFLRQPSQLFVEE
jgi:hypothetical protein